MLLHYTFHIRPERSRVYPQACGHWEVRPGGHTGRPYGLAAAGKGVSDAAVRADIKSAPTDTLAAFS